jgi:hypothetical protein
MMSFTEGYCKSMPNMYVTPTQAERQQILRTLRENNWVVGAGCGAAGAYKAEKLGTSRPRL